MTAICLRRRLIDASQQILDIFDQAGDEEEVRLVSAITID